MERGEVLRSVVVLLMPVERVVTSGIFSLDGEDFEVDNNVWLVGDDAEVLVIDAAHDHEPILAAIGGRRVVGDRRHPRPQRPHQRRRRAGRRHRGADPPAPGRRRAVGPGPPRAVAGTADLADGERARAPAATSCVVLHTPGHTPGGVCLYDEADGVVFSADTLFNGGPGATGRSFSSFPDDPREHPHEAADAAARHRRPHRPRRRHHHRRREARHRRALRRARAGRARNVSTVLTPIVIDDVRPRTAVGLPGQGRGGRAACRCPRCWWPTGTTGSAPGCGGARRATRTWTTAPLVERADHRWTGSVTPDGIGLHQLVVEAWTDRYATWRHEIEVKVAAGQDVEPRARGGRPAPRGAGRAGCKGADRDRLRGGRRRACAARRARSTCASTPPATTPSPRLAAAIPDARRSESAAHAVWVDRRLAAVGAWYELFPRSFGGLRGAADAPRLRGRARLRRRVPAAGPPDRRHPPQGPGQHPRRRTGRPRQPVGHRCGRRAGTRPSHPELGTFADFDAFVDPGGRARPRGGARLRAAGVARPPLGARPPRVVHPAARRLDPLRREPAEEVPGHPPDRLLAGGRGRPRRAVGGVPRRAPRLGRAGRPHLPRRQPPHQAAGVLGLADRRGPPRPPRPRVPGRGVHDAADDGQAGRGRVQPELHVLHLAHRGLGAARVRRRSSPQGPLADYMRPAFWPNTPDILSGPLRRGPRGRVRAAPRAGRHAGADLRHLLRLRAVRERAGRESTRSTSTPRSTS